MSEYHDAMITLLETIWGKGFMAPGGAGNVAKQVDGLELSGKRGIISAGGLSGILNVLLATLEPGDEVLMTDPIYTLAERD